MSGIYEELQRRKVFRAAIAYLVSAWVLLQVADLLVPVLALPDWTTRLVFLLLAIGFVPALILAWAYELAPGGFRREVDASDSNTTSGSGRSPLYYLLIAIVLSAAAGAGGYWFITSDERWARNEAFPQIEKLADSGNWEDAYVLAKRLEQKVPESTALADLWPTIGFLTTIESTPSGANVYRRPYAGHEAEWQALGKTPISDINIPFGLSLLRLELDGYAPIVRVIGGESAGLARLPVMNAPRTGGAAISPGAFIFDSPASIPDGMVRVPRHELSIQGEGVAFEDFFIGRYEVTNAEYKQFVDAGGYDNPAYWEHPFLEFGENVSRESAMARFVDKSGRPGPATWIGGSYADGMADHPVAGISWYEAAAYAKYMSRELPTLHHWRRAHAAGIIEYQLANSNVETGKSAPVGEYAGIGWTGTYDMIGNVREWCFNALGDSRVIVGGGFSDPAYYVHHSITDPGAFSPFNRESENGLRLAETRDTRQIAAMLRAPILPREDMEIGEPVSDAVFEAYLANFEYERFPLDAVIEESIESRHWIRQRVSFASHRAGQRIAAYLYLPNSPATSYQAILYWPTVNALMVDSIDQQFIHLDFALRNGRAVVFPILDGILERRRSTFPDWASIAGRDLVLEAVKDMRRTIDYLESRTDFDDDAIAFYGYSWGGRLGAIALAVEAERFKAGILNQAGLQHLAIPETSVLNYLPRITTPVLQFNGRYDTDFLFETSAKPYFELIGTSEKRHVVNETSHYVPREDIIGETLDWLDKYMGPVNR